MADKTPSVGLQLKQEHASDLMLIDGYGDGGFRVKGGRFDGAILITGEGVWPVEVDASGEPTDAVIALVKDKAIDILLVGRGEAMTPLSKEMRLAFEAASIPYDIMDTGAAARTYNVLLMEERRVAALLKAV